MVNAAQTSFASIGRLVVGPLGKRALDAFLAIVRGTGTDGRIRQSCRPWRRRPLYRVSTELVDRTEDRTDGLSQGVSDCPGITTTGSRTPFTGPGAWRTLNGS